LSGIAELARHLTEANRETLLARAAHKSKRQIEELVAELSPRPDVQASMRKLPVRRPETSSSPAPELRPDGVVSPPAPAAVKPVQDVEPALHVRAAQPVPPAKAEPLAPSRYRVTFTASAELYDKLKRFRVLMRPSVRDGDLAAIIEEAVTEKLERLESKRFGKTKAARKSLERTATYPSSRYIPAAIRRAVCERDGNQCTFVDEKGRRCTERDGLEFHHRWPFGRDGDHSLDNVHLMCRVHNAHLAEREYGKEVMERYRRSDSRVREPAPGYFDDKISAAAPPSGNRLAERWSSAGLPSGIGLLASSRRRPTFRLLLERRGRPK